MTQKPSDHPPSRPFGAQPRQDGGWRFVPWWYLTGGLLILVLNAPALYTSASPSAVAGLFVGMGVILVLLAASEWRGDDEAGRDWLWSAFWLFWIVSLTSSRSPSAVWAATVAAFRNDPASTIWLIGSVSIGVSVALVAWVRRFSRHRRMAEAAKQ